MTKMTEKKRIHVCERGSWLEWEVAEECRTGIKPVKGGISTRHLPYKTVVVTLMGELRKVYGREIEIIPASGEEEYISPLALSCIQEYEKRR